MGTLYYWADHRVRAKNEKRATTCVKYRCVICVCLGDVNSKDIEGRDRTYEARTFRGSILSVCVFRCLLNSMQSASICHIVDCRRPLGLPTLGRTGDALCDKDCSFLLLNLLNLLTEKKEWGVDYKNGHKI